MKTQNYVSKKIALTVVLFAFTVLVAPWLWFNVGTSSELHHNHSATVRLSLSPSTPVAAVM